VNVYIGDSPQTVNRKKQRNSRKIVFRLEKSGMSAASGWA